MLISAEIMTKQERVTFIKCKGGHITFRLRSKESFYWDKTGDECWENEVRNYGETSGTHPLPKIEILGAAVQLQSDTQV